MKSSDIDKVGDRISVTIKKTDECSSRLRYMFGSNASGTQRRPRCQTLGVVSFYDHQAQTIGQCCHSARFRYKQVFFAFLPDAANAKRENLEIANLDRLL